jgi:hypothetical protein
MELKGVQDELTKIKLTEEILTVEFIKRVFGRHVCVLDLSNHFLFEKSTKMLLKLLKTHIKAKNQVKSLVLQNCMITSGCLLKILKLFIKSSSSLLDLNISNNRLTVQPILTQNISLMFSKSSKPKSLCLQGNICASSEAISELFLGNIKLSELNFYDTNLSPGALAVISQALRANACIIKLNLGFNSQAFQDPEVVSVFAESVSENKILETLDLSGNESLSIGENLTKLCLGLRNNRSLSALKIGAINLEDFGVNIIATQLLPGFPVLYLDIQNNGIQDKGFKALVKEFPDNITGLDVSYNNFTENISVLTMASLLIQTKSLRDLIISHSFELNSLEPEILELLCESITKNDSLSEFLCEGVKLPEDPDMFCYKINQAIARRKLSLTYKISAVNCCNNKSTMGSFDTNQKSMKFISNLPSNLSHFKDRESYSRTEKKEFVETPNQEPIVNTSRHYELSTSFS